MAAGADDGRGFVDEWIGLIRRRWRPGLAIFLCVFGLAAWVIVSSAPIYRAEARLQLSEPPPVAGVTPSVSLLGLFGLGGDAFANSLELLDSRTLAELVVEDTDLNAMLRAPEGSYRDSVLTFLAASRATDSATYAVEWRGDGMIALRQTMPEDSTFQATVAPGDTIAFGGIRIAFRPWREEMPRQVKISTIAFADAVRRHREGIVAERTRREANMLELAFEYADPGVAEAVVEATVDRFVQLRALVRGRESSETIDSLRTVANETRRELTAVEAELERLQRTTQLLAPEVQTELFMERYGTVVSELETARAERSALRNLLSRVDSAETVAAAWTGLAAFPRFLQNPAVGDLLGQLTRLQAERVRLVQEFSPQSEAIQAVDVEIASLGKSLRSLTVAYLGALDELILDLEARLREMDARLAAFPRQVIDLAGYKRSITILSKILALTEQRLRIEEIRQALMFANVQVIDPPELLPQPVWPPETIGLFIGLLLAGGFAALGMIVVERADRTTRRASQLRDAADAPLLTVPVRDGGGDPELTGDDARAILDLARNEENDDPVRLTLIECGRNGSAGQDAPAGSDGPAAEIGRALRRALVAEAEQRAGAAPGDEPLIFTAREVTTFASAAAAVKHEAPVVLVCVCGETRRASLERSAELVRKAGGNILGVIAIAGSKRDATIVWS